MKKVTIFVLCACLFLPHTKASAFMWGKKKENVKKEEKLLNAKEDLYRISAGDELKITVYQERDLTGSFEVKEDGTITYPLLGQVYVENLTKMEGEQRISELLRRDYLVNPFVSIAFASYNKRQVLLMGHVTKPGTYVFPEEKNYTLLELITEAGGFTGYANVNGTKIVRNQEGKDKKLVIDPRMNDIVRGKKADIELQPGDLIVVPERLF